MTEAEFNQHRDQFLKLVRDLFEKDGELGSAMAHIFFADGTLYHAVFAGLSSAQQRTAIQDLIASKIDQQPFLVLHAQEVWYATAQVTDAESLRKLREDYANHAIDKREDRKEMLLVFAEGADAPIQRWGAQIRKNEDGKPVLEEWKEDAIKLPYPGFKRYFPRLGIRFTSISSIPREHVVDPNAVADDSGTTT